MELLVTFPLKCGEHARECHTVTWFFQLQLVLKGLLGVLETVWLGLVLG